MLQGHVACFGAPFRFLCKMDLMEGTNIDLSLWCYQPAPRDYHGEAVEEKLGHLDLGIDESMERASGKKPKKRYWRCGKRNKMRSTGLTSIGWKTLSFTTKPVEPRVKPAKRSTAGLNKWKQKPTG